MDNITNYLNLPENAKVLDLACKSSFHYLNQLGFDVLGADLSENSIAEASKDTNDTLHFKVHDMRVPLKKSTMLYLICLPVWLFRK
jgi:cyclopropane fatty-acyl-phospholipid synthase-like methyltransferase